MNKWRTDERRSKKESFAVARENEKVQDMTTDASYSILTSNGNLAKDATKVSLIVYIFMCKQHVTFVSSWRTRRKNWKSP
jgi:hypothetical protein